MLFKGTIGEIFLIKYRDGIAINIRQHLLRGKYHEYLDSDTIDFAMQWPRCNGLIDLSII